jgi:large subunit ribosomal protein L24
MANKNKNAQPRFAPKFKIKKGDRVVVIAGAYKDLDTPREVLEVFPAKSRVIVDQVNIVKKHLKPTQDREGGIQEVPAPIHLSNVMLVDPKTGEPTKIGRKLNDDGKLVRFSKKSGEIIK